VNELGWGRRERHGGRRTFFGPAKEKPTGDIEERSLTLVERKRKRSGDRKIFLFGGNFLGTKDLEENGAGPREKRRRSL